MFVACAKLELVGRCCRTLKDAALVTVPSPVPKPQGAAGIYSREEVKT